MSIRNSSLKAIAVAAIFFSFAAVGQDLLVDSSPARVANEFSPVRALGGAVDRIEMKAADLALEQPMLNEILGAGWQVVSYRQNTELEAEAWHWNNAGTWSDPSGKGYFVGQSTPSAASLDHSFGYALPHRGTTMDSAEQGFHYSKLTDGDAETYWKSNPYLTRHFHRGGRFSSAAVGHRRSRQHAEPQRDSYLLGRPVRDAISSSVLDGRRKQPAASSHQRHLANLLPWNRE